MSRARGRAARRSPTVLPRRAARARRRHAPLLRPRLHGPLTRSPRPFLDHHLVEYCATIPDEPQGPEAKTKYVLKRAARGVVPEFLLAKPKIGFFNRAVGTWFAAQARQCDFRVPPGASPYEGFSSPRPSTGWSPNTSPATGAIRTCSSRPDARGLARHVFAARRSVARGAVALRGRQRCEAGGEATPRLTGSSQERPRRTPSRMYMMNVT